MVKANCKICEPCNVLPEINAKLISIADKKLYNTRYELNRKVDYGLFSLLMFYKGVAEDICKEQDCGCYTGGVTPPCKTDKCELPEVSLTLDNIIERIRILTA